MISPYTTFDNSSSNLSAGPLIGGRPKDFLRPRRGIATRYLDNYLSWFHLVALAPGANDRACLAAAITR